MSCPTKYSQVGRVVEVGFFCWMYLVMVMIVVGFCIIIVVVVLNESYACPPRCVLSLPIELQVSMKPSALTLGIWCGYVLVVPSSL